MCVPCMRSYPSLYRAASDDSHGRIACVNHLIVGAVCDVYAPPLLVPATGYKEGPSRAKASASHHRGYYPPQPPNPHPHPQPAPTHPPKGSLHPNLPPGREREPTPFGLPARLTNCRRLPSQPAQPDVETIRNLRSPQSASAASRYEPQQRVHLRKRLLDTRGDL